MGLRPPEEWRRLKVPACFLDSTGSSIPVLAGTTFCGPASLRLEVSTALPAPVRTTDPTSPSSGSGYAQLRRGLRARRSIIRRSRAGRAPCEGRAAPMDDGGVRAYAVDPDAAARLWELSVAATGATPVTR